MARADLRLSKRIIDAAVVTHEAYFLWDAEVRGFGIRVHPTGHKAFVLSYRTPEGRKRLLTLGRFGEWTVEEARAEAIRRKVALQRDHIDPAAMRDEARKALTVAQLADAYLKDGPTWRPAKKATSWDRDRSAIERHVKPLLGNRPAGGLTKADVAAWQRDVTAGKASAVIKTGVRGKAVVRGGAGTARRALATVAAMYGWAVDQALVKDNPTVGVRPNPSKPRERFLSIDEVKRLGKAMRELEAEGFPRNAIVATRLLLATGARRREITAARWEWVDWERQVLRLPDAKAGARDVFLPPVAIAELEAHRRIVPKESPWIFPGHRGSGPYEGLPKHFKDICARAKIAGLRPHDLRHSAGAFAASGGASILMVAKLLGHKQVRTAERYAHLAADPVAALAARTSAEMFAALDGDSESAQ